MTGLSKPPKCRAEVPCRALLVCLGPKCRRNETALERSVVQRHECEHALAGAGQRDRPVVARQLEVTQEGEPCLRLSVIPYAFGQRRQRTS